MKLFIDDVRNAPDETWTVARTVLSAIRFIARFDFDEISLDHDISHQVTIGTGLERPYPCEETFESVAHYIAAIYGNNPLGKYPRIIIHTSNPVGAKVMEEIFYDANIRFEIKPTSILQTRE